MKVSHAFALIRTLSKAWLTQQRFQQLGSACAVGCPQPDCMRHYWQCPVLAELVTQIVGEGAVEPGWDGIDKLGLMG
eukprot:6649128-Pyramimonas_sp.AAC.1